MTTPYNRFSGQGIERLAALSDGIFAVAMTLLVLDIKVPALGTIQNERDLWMALLALAPRFVMYLMSMLTLGIFWVAQQTQLNQFTHSDRDLTWIHILYLAVVALVPFSTAFLAQYITFRTALLLYWINILALGAVLFGGWIYGTRNGLLREGLPADIDRTVRRRILTAQSLYAVGAALCAIDTWWSIGFIVLVQLNYAIAPRLRRKC